LICSCIGSQPACNRKPTWYFKKATSAMLSGPRSSHRVKTGPGRFHGPGLVSIMLFTCNRKNASSLSVEGVCRCQG
jgi:hypothetical protein